MRKMATLACGAVLAAIAVGIVALGLGGTRADTGEPELGVVPRVESYDDVAFPLDAYHLPPERRITLASAGDVLVRDCVRRYGFDFELPARTVAPELTKNRVIGLVDADEAARFGYKPPWFAAYAQRVDEAKRGQVRWPAEMVDVLYGTGPATVHGVAVPEGGCDAEARRRLGRSTPGSPGDENFIIHLEWISGELTRKDSRLEAAFASWSDCMREAGYRYQDPWQANGDPAFAGERASAHEIAVATADAHCRAEHDVNGIWVAVRSAYQSRLIEANAEALRQHQSAQADQVRTAVDVLADHGQSQVNAVSHATTPPNAAVRSLNKPR